MEGTNVVEPQGGGQQLGWAQVKVEDIDGSYDCAICFESVRGSPDVLRCSQCSSNPFHRACLLQSSFPDTCPQCSGSTLVAGARAPGESTVRIDLDEDLDLSAAGTELDSSSADAVDATQGRRTAPAAPSLVVGVARPDTIEALRARFGHEGLWNEWKKGAPCALFRALEILPTELWGGGVLWPAERTVMLGATSKRVRALLAGLQRRVPAAVQVVNSASMEAVARGLRGLQAWCQVVRLDLNRGEETGGAPDLVRNCNVVMQCDCWGGYGYSHNGGMDQTFEGLVQTTQYGVVPVDWVHNMSNNRPPARQAQQGRGKERREEGHGYELSF